MIWSEEHKQEVVSLWQTYTASEIANLFRERGFPITRNSVIGIANRAGCSKPRPPGKPRKSRAKKAPQIQLKVVARVAFEPAAVDLPLLNKTFSDLAPNDCRYITGEPAEALYCGHPVHKHSFCLVHFQLCYTTTEARKPNPAAFTSGFRARAA